MNPQTRNRIATIVEYNTITRDIAKNQQVIALFKQALKDLNAVDSLVEQRLATLNADQALACEALLKTTGRTDIDTSGKIAVLTRGVLSRQAWCNTRQKAADDLLAELTNERLHPPAVADSGHPQPA